MASLDEVFDAITADLNAKMQTTGEDLATELRYKVGVPVQYVTGPRGGRRVIRSRPGEPPRKETGALQASINAETVSHGDVVETAVSAEASYARTLQEQLNRPITEGEMPLVEARFLDAAVSAINGD